LEVVKRFLRVNSEALFVREAFHLLRCLLMCFQFL
jgi:hypothetical protein